MPGAGRGGAALLAALACSSCAGLDRNDQGRLQPQTVRGPCQVDKFFIMRLSAVPVTVRVTGPGGACVFTIFNPDLEIVLSAALVTAPPRHGRAEAVLITDARQAAIAYTPAPGYAGPDRFDVTLEPNDRSLTVRVTVQ